MQTICNWTGSSNSPRSGRFELTVSLSWIRAFLASITVPIRSLYRRPASCHLVLLLAIFLPIWKVQAAPRKLRVLTSFLPLYCFTANVAGEFAEVENLLPPGMEPHDFQLSPREMKRIAAADLLVVNGLGLEAWLDKVINSSTENKTVVLASQGISGELIRPRGTDDSVRSLPNPHLWLDPCLAAIMIQNILAGLQKADPSHAAEFAHQATLYLSILTRLDADLKAALGAFHDQPILTYHDAFPYFARRYGLRIAGVLEETPEVPPSARHLAALANIIRTEKVSVIFSEHGSSPRLPQMMGRDYHMQVAILNTLETGDLKPEAYEVGMRQNLQTLKDAWK